MICLDWVALPGVQTPADVALSVIDVHMLPYHDEILVLIDQHLKGLA